MENNFLLTEDILWDYADGLLSAEETRRVNAYLQQHPEQKKRLEAILNEKKSLSTLPMESPNRNFSQKLMTAWTVEQYQSRVAARGSEKDWMLRAIMIGFAALVLVPLCAAFFAADQTVLPQPMSNVDMPMFLQKMDWGSFWAHPAFLYALIIGFAYLSLRFIEKYLHNHGLLQLKTIA